MEGLLCESSVLGSRNKSEQNKSPCLSGEKQTINYTGYEVAASTMEKNSLKGEKEWVFSSVQSFSPVRLCNPMNHTMPGLPVHHQLPELTQTHVHRVGDAIQPSHPLSSPSPPALNLSQE